MVTREIHYEWYSTHKIFNGFLFYFFESIGSWKWLKNEWLWWPTRFMEEILWVFGLILMACVIGLSGEICDPWEGENLAGNPHFLLLTPFSRKIWRSYLNISPGHIFQIDESGIQKWFLTLKQHSCKIWGILELGNSCYKNLKIWSGKRYFWEINKF